MCLLQKQEDVGDISLVHVKGRVACRVKRIIVFTCYSKALSINLLLASTSWFLKSTCLAGVIYVPA
jgi:hypothetical protein